MPCEPRLLCSDGLCIDPAVCLVTWGVRASDATASVMVSPITAEGRIGSAVGTPTDAEFGLSGEAVGPDMLVPCGDRLYAVEPSDHAIGVFELESDLTASFPQHYTVPLGVAPATLRALECVDGNALVAVAAVNTVNAATNILRGSLHPLDDSGLVAEEDSFDTTTITSAMPFESVRTAWSDSWGRGYLVFDSPAAPTMYFRHIDVSGTGISISGNSFLLGDGPRDKVGGIEVSPSGDVLAMVGLNDPLGTGSGGAMPIESSGLLSESYIPIAEGSVPLPVLGGAGALTPVRLGDAPPVLGFSGGGVAVFANFDAAPAAPLGLLEIEGSGRGAVLTSADGQLLVVVNDTTISTYDATVGIEGFNDAPEPIETAEQPAELRAASLLLPCPM